MREGSLVLCTHTFYERHGEVGIKRPVANQIYTIRGFTESDGDTGVWLEEIVNPPLHYENGYHEISFYIIHFRELQPPMDIQFTDLLPEPEHHAEPQHA
jgi:hypothetical protein